MDASKELSASKVGKLAAPNRQDGNHEIKQATGVRISLHGSLWVRN
jgi:hypothetical protein